jgi:hypothetical protein
MSRIDEIKRMAQKHGTARTIDDHTASYFATTGVLADGVAIKGVRAQINRELRSGGKLETVRDLFQPSPRSSGRQAEWTVGLEPGDNELVLEPMLSKELTAVKAIYDLNEFKSITTVSALARQINRAATLSRVAQQDISLGTIAIDFERRALQMDIAANEKTNAHNEENLRNERAHSQQLTSIINHMMAASGVSPSNARGVTRRRDTPGEE